jgi:hypothetical protein
MPSPRPPRTITRRDFRAPAIGKRKVQDIPPRARQLIELMTWENLRLDEAAARMGIKSSTARQYHALPGSRRYYLQILDRMRESELARNLHTAVEIRDDGTMKASAAGNRARIESMRFLEHRDQASVTFNANIGINNVPGYQVGISQEHADAAVQLLKKAGSIRRIEGVVAVEGTKDVADAEVIEEAPGSAADAGAWYKNSRYP